MRELREYTMARVGLGRAGTSLATKEVLEFQLAHSLARDAVYSELDAVSVCAECTALGWDAIRLQSGAVDRKTFLVRPDLGRRLSSESRGKLARGSFDLAVVIADGLAALAVHRQAIPLLQELTPLLEGWKIAPVSVLSQGRVAAGDEVAFAVGAQMVLVLIGERPGLSSPDSLGAYLTWQPFPGRTDAERNCISNIRAEGVGYQEGAQRLAELMNEARRLELTGVMLKERLGLADIGGQNGVGLAANHFLP